MSFVCPEACQTLLRIARTNLSSSIATRALSTTSLRWPCANPPGNGHLRPLPKSSVSLQCNYANRRTIFSPKVVRDYEELHKEYRDQEGLPFGADLTEAQVDKIFGKGLSPKTANYLLRVLHGRRVAGTLQDPAYAVNTAQFSGQQISTALAYLRKKVPVEEIRNAGLRAEDELEQLEKDLAKEKEKANKKPEDVEEPEEEVKADPVYGRSQFDEIRARNRAKQKAREREEEEERLAAETRGGAEKAGPIARREDGTRVLTNPKIQEYYDKATSDEQAPPELKLWQSVLPSVTFVALVLGFMAAVSMVYEEPSTRYRFLKELSTAQATVASLVAINVVVWLGWKVPPLWRLFNNYMVIVIGKAKPVTMFTAMFSHLKLNHLVTNMVPLWFVGTQMHEELGRADFLTLYLGCGALGFLGSLVTYTLRGWTTVTTLGGSGATLGLCSAYFWEHRADGFKILGLPQEGVHGIVFLALIVALQLAAFGRTAAWKLDLASHLGGITAGVVGVEMINRSQRRRKEGKDKTVFEIFSPKPRQ